MARSRLLPVVLALHALCASTVLAQTAAPGVLAPAVRTDVRQLRQIAKQVVHQDERLAKVLTHVGPPDQPLPTAIRTELGEIRAQATSIVNRAAPYLGTATLPPPSSPPATPLPAGIVASARGVRQLDSIGRRLVELDERFARVLTHVGPPDQPIPDAIKAEIASIKAAASGILAHVAPYLASSPTPLPPPPTDG